MLNDLSHDITALGGLPVYAAITGIFLAIDVNMGIKLLVGVAIAYALTATIRATYYRERPKARSYNNLLTKIDASSFPSLHSMRATILSGLLGLYLNSVTVWSVLTFCWLLACATRVELEKHYVSDVIAGAFLGVLIVIGLNGML